MTNAYLAPLPKFRAWDNNGNPLANGQVLTYAAGTTTPIATYTDSTAVTPNANPVILNARGEADIWLKPNIAYKLVLQDSLSNVIWTVDQIVNSQLITLYGGVDGGSANAYTLTFTASFTSYTDGIVIYWVPSNTNTGASTININGLGVINIINPDGSALVAGEIVANQPAQILIKAGAAQLITAATVIYGTIAPTWTGFSANPTGSIVYRKSGSMVSLSFPGTTGTSNATTFSFTNLPTILRPGVSLPSVAVPIFGMVDNSANIASGMAVVSGSTVTFYKDGAQTAWTAAGLKGFQGLSSPTILYPV